MPVHVDGQSWSLGFQYRLSGNCGKDATGKDVSIKGKLEQVTGRKTDAVESLLELRHCRRLGDDEAKAILLQRYDVPVVSGASRRFARSME